MTDSPAATGEDHRFSLVVALAGAAFAVSVVVLEVGSPSYQRNLSNLLEIGAPTLAAWSAIRAGRRAAGRGWRVGWYLIAASCASWCIGQMIWTWFETIEGRTTPFPSMADFFYLLAIPLALGGLLAMPSSDDDRSDRMRVVLDGVIVACSLLLVSWVTVLGPTLASGTGGWYERAIALAYPAGDVVVLTMVLIACGRSDPAGRMAVGLAGAGFACFALADSLFVYTSLRWDDVSNLSNDAWVAGYLLIALGALHATHHPAARVSELARPQPESVARSPRFWLPYVPVAVVLVLCVVEAVVNDPIVVGPAEFFIGTALIVALLVRQAVVIIENGRLTRSLAASNQQLQYQLLHDDLTGLPNRPLMLDRLRGALSRMERSRSQAAVMFVDLDLFKQANDTYGHEAGDEVLIAVGHRLVTSLRVGDTVARFGGDEFVVLCEEVQGAAEADHLAERVLGAVTRPVPIGVGVNGEPAADVVVHASVGLVLTDDPSAQPEAVVRAADAAMYRAKRNGRSRVEVTDERLARDRSTPSENVAPSAPAGRHRITR